MNKDLARIPSGTDRSEWGAGKWLCFDETPKQGFIICFKNRPADVERATAAIRVWLAEVGFPEPYTIIESEGSFYVDVVKVCSEFSGWLAGATGAGLIGWLVARYLEGGQEKASKEPEPEARHLIPARDLESRERENRIAYETIERAHTHLQSKIERDQFSLAVLGSLGLGAEVLIMTANGDKCGFSGSLEGARDFVRNVLGETSGTAGRLIDVPRGQHTDDAEPGEGGSESPK